jgi:hypothetical protein
MNLYDGQCMVHWLWEMAEIFIGECLTILKQSLRASVDVIATSKLVPPTGYFFYVPAILPTGLRQL